MSYGRMEEEEEKIKGKIAELLRHAHAVERKPKTSSMARSGGTMSFPNSYRGARTG
jgi:hypothetical protein